MGLSILGGIANADGCGARPVLEGAGVDMWRGEAGRLVEAVATTLQVGETKGQ